MFFLFWKGKDREMNYLKKFKKILLAIPLLLFGAFIVYAETNDSRLQRIEYDGYMAAYDGTDRMHLYYAERYTLNGTTAYCIEIGTKVTEDIYSSTNDWSITGLSSDVRNYIRLVAYYGYDYSGHNTMKYYMAAQELIWEKINGREVYWVQGNTVSSPKLDVETEKNEIINLVNNHTKRPSFDDNTIEVNLGESKTIADNNGVLSSYQIYHSDIEASINGNSLTVKANNTRGNNEVQLIKKNYTTKVNFLYYNGESQKMISSGVLDPVISSLTIKTTSGNVTINKLDRETGNVAQGDATLNGAKYNVINSKGEVVDTLITGSDNTRSKELPYGTYKLKEVSPSVGYELDENEYVFTLDNNNIDIKVDVFENVIKRTVNFFKVYASDKSTVLKGEPNVTFDIYLKSTGKKYTSFTTDKDGYGHAELVYGTYIVKQVTSTKDYEKVDDFEVVVNEDTKNPNNILISNAEITAKLKVVKFDKESGKTIKRSGITFKIKDANTNEYVCQRITYPTVQDVCEYSTDENGEFITPYPLNSGKYILEEVDGKIDGYTWNKESVEFEIGENSKFIKDENDGILFEVKFENKRVKGNIELKKFGEIFDIQDGTYEYKKTKLEGIEFGLYALEDIILPTGETIYKKNELITKITTDKDGYVTIEDLELGKYYLKELSTIEDYVLDENIYPITLEYKDQYIEVVTSSLEIQNYLKKGTLIFSKIDISSSEPLPNTTIEIYTDKDELIYTGVTNEQGQIVIDNLKVGRYYLLEKNAPDGYKINPEKMFFEIRENDEIVKCTMVDERIEIEVPNTGLKGFDMINPISLVLLCLGIGVVAYAIKKKRK